MALSTKAAFWICMISSVVIYALVLAGTILECTSEASAFELSPACIIGIITSVLFGLLLIASVIFVVSSLTGDSRRSVTPDEEVGTMGRSSYGGGTLLALDKARDRNHTHTRE